MNNHFAFLPMQASNDLLGAPDALRERLAQDGYLYFERILPEDRIASLRKSVLGVLGDHGWIDTVAFLGQGVCTITPMQEGEPEYLAVYNDVQKLEEFHTLAHHPVLVDLMAQVLGPNAFPHPLKIARLAFPDHYEASTPPHQDHPNNQGTQGLTATWVPLSEIPLEMGPLAILRGSNRWGPLPLAAHLGPGNRCAVIPPDMAEECRWVTTEFHQGDVLVFGSTTVHASLHNATEFLMRLSVDFRYQLPGEALTPVCLEPHFQQITWEEVYEGWESTEHQYYWKDLDYQVVPFETLPVVNEHVLSENYMARAMRYQARRDARVARRLEALLEVTGRD
jgi:ectoine hydroxylase-related dioxygenase (phytanoyl-CoA dioxygenase family)